MKSARVEAAPERRSAVPQIGPKCQDCTCFLTVKEIEKNQSEGDARGLCAVCKERPAAKSDFSLPERSLIKLSHGYMSIEALLTVLNERRMADQGERAKRVTADMLHLEIIMIAPDSKGGSDWAGLRKALAAARKSGTLALITDQVIMDFAVVFQLSPGQLSRLKDVILSAQDDEDQE